MSYYSKQFDSSKKKKKEQLENRLHEEDKQPQL